MSLADLLQDAQEKLLALRRRQFVLDAFQAELDRVSRGEMCSFHNDIVWTLLLDHRDKNVIDLASWAKAAYSPGGLFGAIQAHHPKALAKKRTWGSDEDDHLARLLDANFFARHEALFSRSNVKPEDIAILRNEFSLAVDPLMADRNNHRAHIFESEPGDVRMLDLGEVRELYDAIRDLLNDLSLLSVGSTWELVNLNAADTSATACELVDMILLPEWVRRQMGKQGHTRESVYDSLHADLAARPAAGNFNSLDRFTLLFPLR